MEKKRVIFVIFIICIAFFLSGSLLNIFDLSNISKKKDQEAQTASYWVDAYDWLSKQDLTIQETNKRPLFISTETCTKQNSIVAGHPTIAGLIDDGLIPISNFHIAQSEEEAVAVWIVQLLLANIKSNDGFVTENVGSSLSSHLGYSIKNDIVKRLENLKVSSSDNPQLEIELYQNISSIICNNLDDEGITRLYHDLQETTGHSIRYYGCDGNDFERFDDFTKSTNNEGVFGTHKNFYPAFFDTIFYKTYFGLEEYEYNLQMPCSGLKHFYASYISNLSENYSQYYSGIASVVIAKYYEGAVVSGNLVFNYSGTIESMDIHLAVTKPLAYTSDVSYNIDHDKVVTKDGRFSVIVGAGGIIEIRRYPELDSGIPWYGGKSFILKEIDLNISDEAAMRKTDDWQIDLGKVTIEPANINGYIFDNLDGKESYDPSKDQPLHNVSVLLYGINKFEQNLNDYGYIQIMPTEFDYNMFKSLSTDENGYYNLEGLKPGYYMLQVSIDDISIERNLIPLYTGINCLNISKPKPADLEGYVYYDENQNNKQDSGEELAQAKVELIHYDKTIKETTTDNTGFYSFKSITPGNIRGTGINTYTVKVTQLPEYQSEVTVSPTENTTTSLNISIGLAPVNVTGYTRYTNNAVGDVTVEFNLDETKSNNTAIPNTVTSSETTGYYQIALAPGYYNVNAFKMDGSTLVYQYNAALMIKRAQCNEEFNIALSKESKTVNGITKDQFGNAVGGVTIEYKPDGTVENNNAIYSITNSNLVTGFYSIDLNTGSYNVTATKWDEVGTKLYESKSNIIVKDDDDERNIPITVDKKTVNLSGVITYNGEGKKDMTIIFLKDASIDDNQAVFAYSISSQTGSYYVELKPGSYKVTVLEEEFNISGVNYTYVISEDSDKLVVSESQIPTGYEFNIKLDIKEEYT